MKKPSSLAVALSATLCIIVSATFFAAELPTAKAFATGDFAKTYRPKLESWPLKDGEINTTFMVPDPEIEGQSRSVSITDSPRGPKRISWTWIGTSNYSPAKFSPTKERFLRDTLRSAASSINADQVVNYFKKQGRHLYPDGSSTMPRESLGSFKEYVGESHYVGPDIIDSEQ